MSVTKAKAYYNDRTGPKKLNCAQAVIAGFRDEFGLDENAVQAFAAFGSGRAPEGECGAMYAAKFILKGDHQEKIDECRDIFISKAGSVKCKEIRQFNKLPCLGCVETAAEFIDKVKGQKAKTVALEMISPKAALDLISKDPTVRLLDVRSAIEFNGAHIKGSVNIPIDMLSAKLNEISRSGKTYIILCRTGNRSSMAVAILKRSGVSSVKVMDGGITKWQKDKLPVIKGAGGISLERQVRIGAGSLVLAGILLGILVNPWFLSISLFVSCGLIYAGLTDNCMMGILLMKLPYNKKLYQDKVCEVTCSV